MHVAESLWASIGKQIATAVGKPFEVKRQRSVGGGCINETYVVEDEGGNYFVKLNQADKAFMFEAEAAGLAEIAATGTVRVPLPVCTGSIGSVAFLVLEYIQLKEANNASQCELGRRLAAMHRVGHGQFGWTQNNTIGTTPQKNSWTDNWITFWRDNRLGVQLGLAARHGAPGTLLHKGDHLMSEIALFFSGNQPKPSLLHGDLWGSNWAADMPLKQSG